MFRCCHACVFDSITTSAPMSRRKLWIVSIAVSLGLSYCIYQVLFATYMPRDSFSGSLDPLSADGLQIRNNLLAHVRALSLDIGERNLQKHRQLEAAAEYIADKLKQSGYEVRFQQYEVAGKPVSNVEAVLGGAELAQQNIVIGAHYDTVAGTPGANDNASGVAAVLELARLMKTRQPRRTVRFVLFPNEEPPYFQTPQMGSMVYARDLKQRNVRVEAMLSLETIGAYSDKPGSQTYPGGLDALYPSTGNFIGFVGNTESGALVRRVIRAFRDSTRFPSEGAAAPASLPGVGWSDHWSFWQHGYPAVMVTDTAPFRYEHYHAASDTPDKLDFDRMAIVVAGLQHVTGHLANE